MKTSLLLLFAFICAKPCYTQWKNPGDRIPTNTPAQVLAFGGSDTSFFASFASWHGSAPHVYRYTPDSSRVWTEFDANGGVRNVTSFCTIGRYILAGSSDGMVFRTTDNGVHWSQIFVGAGTLETLGSHIFAAGDAGIYHSSDTGVSWIQVSKQNSMALVAFGPFLISGGLDGTLRSSDAGIHWAPVPLPSPFGNLGCFATVDSTLFSGPVGLRSTDSGLTWSKVALANRYIHTLATDGSHLFAGTDSGIYVSTDSGITWRAENDGLKDVWTGGPSRMWTGAMAVFDTLLFVSINNYIDGGGFWSTFVRPISQMVPPKSGVKSVASVPVRDTLEVFPNPASGLVTIRGSYSIERVSVLNVLGAEMLNVPNIRENELTLDLSHFASGTYFLRIETGHGTVMRKVVRE